MSLCLSAVSLNSAGVTKAAGGMRSGEVGTIQHDSPATALDQDVHHVVLEFLEYL
jgi:hypothetical protein